MRSGAIPSLQVIANPVWIFLAICSAASLGLANIAHKRLLDNYLEGVGALGAGSILTRSICAAIILIAVGWPVGAPAQSVAIALLSGVSLGSGLLLLFLGLKLGEASRAVAVSQTNPILVALLAMVVLGETITAPQWAAIALVVIGVALVSIEGFGRGLLKLTPGLTVLVGSSITLGLSFFLAKLVLTDLTPWEVFGLQELGMVPAFAVYGRPENWRRLFNGLRSGPALTTFVSWRGSAAPAGHHAVHLVLQPGAGVVGVGDPGHATAVRVRSGHAAELAHVRDDAGIPAARRAGRQGHRHRDDRRRDDHAGGPVT